MAGRYAPSPSGPLHIGNLRTAVLAWVWAQHSGIEFRLRVDDLDGPRSDADVARQQLEELAALGISHSGPVLWQSHRHEVYQQVIEELTERGLVYECYCSRKDILAAPRAPHAAPGAYPGTCRELSEAERSRRRTALGPGRAPALRLRSEVTHWQVEDLLHGHYTGVVDDVVLRRGDGQFAYNLAVVVDDHAQGVTQVVRGEDLLSSTPRQAYLAELIGYEPVVYAHVPLVFTSTGQRVAKRDGALGIADWAARGVTLPALRRLLIESLGVEGVETLPELARVWDPQRYPPRAWRVPAEAEHPVD